MLEQKPSIVIQKLVLVGRRKNYVIPFSEGVNIVYGDSATGKSSVLECINYLFGSS
jgi:AAA15 family ATPase/GTPase